MKESHEKAMEDMAAAVEMKEQMHVQAMNDLERKYLTDKANLQKVGNTGRGVWQCRKCEVETLMWQLHK